jgi:hypothetical protein
MSVFPSASQVREAALGLSVAGAAKNLPATTSQGIFTVSGGRVLITSLIGIVTTAVQNQACTLSVGFTPTGGSLSAAALATASSIINLAVGAMVAIPQNQTGLVVGSASPGVLGPGNGATSVVSLPGDGGVCILNSGTISVSTSATNTGALKYSLTYVPYDDGATVTAL